MHPGGSYRLQAMALYAEGYSVTRFLVAARDRSTFLAFVKQGMHEGWDAAVREHYDYDSIEALEKAWLQSLSGHGTLEDQDAAQRKEPQPETSSEAMAQPASLLVHLPPEAKLFIDDEPTRSRSSPRRFHTPPLQPNRDFHYTLRAEMDRDGERLSMCKTVTVRAGQLTTLRLSFPRQ
jgi:uncharacterized protein (TIGR03000 family)